MQAHFTAGTTQIHVLSGERRLIDRVRLAVCDCSPDTAFPNNIHLVDAANLDDPDAEQPGAAKILLYTRINSSLLEKSAHAGFNGFLSVSRVTSRLCEAIDSLSAGQAFLDHEALEIVLNRNGVSPVVPNHDHVAVETLTPREREVFEYLVRGVSIRDIGTQLSISERTVEVHRRRILERLGLSNVVQLFHVAFQAGIVTRDELLAEFSQPD